MCCHLGQPLPEISMELVVIAVFGRQDLMRTEPPHDGGNPISSLDVLIDVTLNLEWRAQQMARGVCPYIVFDAVTNNCLRAECSSTTITKLVRSVWQKLSSWRIACPSTVVYKPVELTLVVP
jgi:hypothetical protein